MGALIVISTYHVLPARYRVAAIHALGVQTGRLQFGCTFRMRVHCLRNRFRVILSISLKVSPLSFFYVPRLSIALCGPTLSSNLHVFMAI